ncbi:DUF3558 domain-containing protein [Saccharothrix isguenensis]
MRRVVPLIAALALLGGCSQATDGSATPGDPGSAPTGRSTPGSAEPTSEESASKEPSKRPKAVDIADVDPCTLLTEPQRAEFGLDRPPQLDEEVPGKKGCTISREDRTHFVGITADTTAGIGDYAEAGGKVTKLEVGGFPALLVESTTALGLSCSIAVDVSDGQVVDVDAMSVGETDLPTLCQIVQPVAAAVVANVGE